MEASANNDEGLNLAPDPGEVDEDAVRMRAALMKLGQRLRAIDAGTGFATSELSALGAVVRRESIRASELARIEGVNPTMLSRLLAHLADEGAVTRREDPVDRRATLIEPTERGRLLHRRLQAVRAKALDTVVHQLPDPDRRRLTAALPALEALAELMKERRR